METKLPSFSYPTETYNAESKGDQEVEVREVDYPEEACLGAVYQCGKIKSGRPLFAGSN